MRVNTLCCRHFSSFAPLRRNFLSVLSTPSTSSFSSTSIPSLPLFKQCLLTHSKRFFCQNASSQLTPTTTTPTTTPTTTTPTTTGGKPLLSVREVTSEDSVEEIFKSQQPVVWRGLAKDWPCMEWKDFDTLKQKVGEEIVPVEVGKTYLDPELEQLGATMNDLLNFIQNFMHVSPSTHGLTNVYFAQQMLSDSLPMLLQDIKEPAIVIGRFPSIQGWFGPCGTVTPAHTDPYNNVLVQTVGRKYVRLYSSADSHRMHPFPTLQRKNTSQVDVLEPNLNSFPDFAQAQGYEVTLEPGDGIFIPFKWWHCCKAVTGSLSVNFWF